MGDTIVKHSPVTGKKLGEYPIYDKTQVAAAVGRARAAFATWRARSLDERLAQLAQLATLINTEGEALARTISRDTGKPLVDSLMTELISIPLFLNHYRKIAHKTLRSYKVKTPLVFAGAKSYVEYFPMGVIAVISPWNFPFQLAMIPILSALIGGNTVVLKPSEVTPMTGALIEKLFGKLDLPRGTVEVVHGDGRTGAALVGAEIDKVFFTGSVATGRKVMAAAAERGIPVELELGGKDAMIVCADANLERAAQGAVWGGLLNCGQVCTSVERVLVVESIYDAFLPKLEWQIKRITMGEPEEHLDVGPLTAPAQLEIVKRQVADAVEKGAKILCGGEQLERPGQFYAPTLLVDVTPEMEIYREETFGPVIPVTRVKDEDEAIRLANDHVYGLTGSVWTADLKRGRRLASRLECGQVMVNDVLTSVANPAIPFGGVKASGFGRYHGPEGLTTFMHKKAVMTNKGKQAAEPFWFPYADKYDDVLDAFHRLLAGKLLSVLKPLKRLNKINKNAYIKE
jgi:acyl-CoA reductase-like NAD-dependent aldehyde dehydrogenase